MPISHRKNTENKKDKDSIYSPKSISPIETSADENYLDESHDTEFKRTFMNFIKKFKFKEDTKKQLNEIKRESLERINA